MIPTPAKRNASDITRALRELLLARANGSISEVEFEQRQSALHAAVLLAEPSKFSLRTLLLPALIVAAAGALYLWLGNPAAVRTGAPLVGSPSTEATPSEAHAGGDLNDMVKRLAEKLDKDPNNGEGWALLGHSYVELRQHADAAAAFAKAAALLPPDAGLLADWADAYVMAHDRKWDAQSRDILKRALRADGKHLKTLALAGSEAFDRQDHRQAIEYWKRLKGAAPADSMDAKLADANISEARSLLGGNAGTNQDTASVPAAAAAFISGTVKLSPKAREKAAPSDTVFVVAKAADGKGPPLAVVRFRVAELPKSFRLDETSSMVPGISLDGHQQVLLLARLSKTGNAIAGPQDVQTVPKLTKVGNADLVLKIGED